MNGSQSPARFDANRWRGMVCRFSRYRARYGPNGFAEWETLDAPEPGESCAYSDFIPDPDGRYFISELLSGSDYSGSSVERANYRVFLEDFGDRDGVHEV